MQHGGYATGSVYNYGSTPLMLAAERGSLDVVKFLLGDDHSYSGERGDNEDTPLLCAAYGGRGSCVLYSGFSSPCTPPSTSRTNSVTTQWCLQPRVDSWKLCGGCSSSAGLVICTLGAYSDILCQIVPSPSSIPMCVRSSMEP
jgi:hypothetical protein